MITNSGPFSTFAQNFLVGSYLLGNSGQNDLYSGDVLDSVNLMFREDWVYKAIAEGKSKGWYQGPALAGGDREQPVLLTGPGMREAERLIQSGVNVELRQGSDELSGEKAPQESQIVKLDRDSQRYLQVENDLGEIERAIDSIGGPENAERSRIRAGIAAARELWKAEELEVIQIKVGILLAVENASAFLKRLGKDVTVGLIVDGVKEVIKKEAAKLLGLS